MNLNRSRRSVRPWYVIGLAVAAAAVIAVGITELGTPTSSARTSNETVTAANGVVQTSVSGSGNVEPGVDQSVNFGTGGTLQSVNVTVGQHVKKGQLLASLDPSTAELTLEEARTSLTAAEDQLTADEDGASSSSSSSARSSSGSASSGSSSATTASIASAAKSESDLATASFVSIRKPNDGVTGTATTTTPTASTTTTTTTPATTTATTTTPATTRTTPKPTATTPKRTATTPRRTATTPKRTVTTAKRTVTTPKPTSTKRPATTTKTTTTAAQTKTTSAVQIAQATEQVQAAQETVKSDEAALDHTKLYAPVSGTIASLSSDTIGQTISSGGSSSGGSSSSGSSSSAAAASAASSSSSGSSGSSSAGSGFAEIIDSKTMTMTVSLSESDISSVKVGQVATVSISALSGVELGGHVTAISPLGTDSSGVVTYDATLTIDQTNAKVLPGMSATATIVTQQAQGVTVPNQAITGSGTSGTVELIKNGKATPQTVVVGLRGSSRSEIVSGLKSGQQVQITITLPALGASSASSSSSSSTLGGTTGLGGGGGGLRAGLRAFFGGGGGGAP